MIAVERLDRAVRRQALAFIRNETGGNIYPDLNGYKFPRISE